MRQSISRNSTASESASNTYYSGDTNHEDEIEVDVHGGEIVSSLRLELFARAPPDSGENGHTDSVDQQLSEIAHDGGSTEGAPDEVEFAKSSAAKGKEKATYCAHGPEEPHSCWCPTPENTKFV